MSNKPLYASSAAKHRRLMTSPPSHSGLNRIAQSKREKTLSQTDRIPPILTATHHIVDSALSSSLSHSPSDTPQVTSRVCLDRLTRLLAECHPTLSPPFLHACAVDACCGCRPTLPTHPSSIHAWSPSARSCRVFEQNPQSSVYYKS